MILFDEGEKPQPKPKEEEAKKERYLPGLKLECEGGQNRTIPSSETTVYKLDIVNTSTTEGNFEVKVDIYYPKQEEGKERIEWHVELWSEGRMKWENTALNNHTLRNIVVKGNSRKTIEYHVTAPSGAKYGDAMTLFVYASSQDNPGIQDNLSLTTQTRQAFMAVKTQIGQERNVSTSLWKRAEEKNVELSSILNPHPLRGYIIIESMKSDRLKDIIKSIRRAKGIVEGEMSFEEIEKYLTPKAIVSGIVEGDIVELVAGPFKGEKARVQSINEDKEEITVELFEAMVPIPVTVRGDSVRVIEKEKNKVSNND